jgi:predicted dehydrogenase
MISAQPGPRFRVLGTHATFTKFGLDVQEAALRAGARPGDAGWGEEASTDWGSLTDGETMQRFTTERGAYESFYVRVAASLQGDGTLPVDARDAVATAAIIDAAMVSAEDGRVVAVEATPALASTRSLG